MLLARFEHAIPASERLRTDALDQAVTGIGKNLLSRTQTVEIFRILQLYGPILIRTDNGGLEILITLVFAHSFPFHSICQLRMGYMYSYCMFMYGYPD